MGKGERRLFRPGVHIGRPGPDPCGLPVPGWSADLLVRRPKRLAKREGGRIDCAKEFEEFTVVPTAATLHGAAAFRELAPERQKLPDREKVGQGIRRDPRARQK